MRTLALLLLTTCTAFGADQGVNPWVTSGPNSLTIQRPQSLVITCGQAGNITISLDTGEATFNGCAPNEAARQFWLAVKNGWGIACPDK